MFFWTWNTRQGTSGLLKGIPRMSECLLACLSVSVWGRVSGQDFGDPGSTVPTPGSSPDVY